MRGKEETTTRKARGLCYICPKLVPMKKVLLFLITAVAVAGCTITERVTFNAKNGGSIAYEIDATEFIGFMNMADSTGENSFNLGDSLADLKESTATLQKIPGISQVNLKGDTSKVTFSFDFDNIDALNKAHTELGVQTQNEGTKSYEKVTVKNKKELIYRTWPLGTSAKDSVYETMGMMLTYRLELNLPKEVVSTSSKTATVNGSKVIWQSSAEDNGGEYAFDGIKIKMK